MLMYTPPMFTFIIIILCITSCDAFTVASHAHRPCKYKRSRCRCYIATQDQDASANINPSTISTTSPSSKASSLDLDTGTIRLEVEVCASSNIHPKTELPHLLQLISSTCTAEEYDGIIGPININTIDNNSINNNNIHSLNKVPDLTPGVLGRVLLINININAHGDSSNDEDSPNVNELVSQWKIDLSEQIDAEMYQSQSGNIHIIKQPILLAFQVNTNANGGDKSNNNNTATTTTAAATAEQLMHDAIENEISDYSLREAVNDVCLVPDDDDADADVADVSLDSLLSTDSSNNNSLGVGCFIHPYQFEINCFPSSVIEIDGDIIDMVVSSSSSSTMLDEYNNDNDGGRDTTEQQQQQEEEKEGNMHFDTSSVLVFDKLIDKSLRKRLLNVVKGYPEDHVADDGDWNDIENGPDPSRWVRGGLEDVMNDANDDDTNDDGNSRGSSCWGLINEAIMDMCYNDHPAIAEFESKLSMLFPDFVVSRLSEAVLGDCVSPLTANAPTHGDTFNYHIDCDPLQVPPSPWADVFGRYPNRNRGKPRFVSCLVYLNDKWDEKEWGAPTRFLDPPTEEVIEVHPKPGRCVIMDQDISHTVVAPNAEAGKRPRYSLVWKLVLHPTEDGQEMDLSSGRKSLWPEPIKIGSANQ